ncbi:MAG: AAA family ATPase, partial [Psychrobium sp.]|nr:AAA family ATPase [Psychrobium sp.]
MSNMASLSVEQVAFNEVNALQVLQKSDWLDAVGLSLGQSRAQNAFNFFAKAQCRGQHLFMLAYSAIDSKALIRELLQSNPLSLDSIFDVVYCEDIKNPRQPIALSLPKGQGIKFSRLVASWLKNVANTDKTQSAVALVEPLLTVFKRQATVVSYLTDLAKQLDNGHVLSHPVLCHNFVSHLADESFPIVFCDNPDYSKLFGQIAMITEHGTTVANHHLMQPGLLHQANGGVLILPAERLLDDPSLWFELKSALFDKKINWSGANQWLTPQAIDLNLQVILLGDAFSYKNFLELEPDVAQLFPLIAEVNHQFNIETDEQITQYAGYLQNIARRCNGPDLSNEGIVRLMALSSQTIDHQEKMCLDSTMFKALLQQAQTFVTNG